MSNITLEDLEEVQENLRSGKKEFEKLNWELDSVKGKLKEEFGVTSIAAAERKMKEIEKKAETISKRIDARVSQLMKKYGVSL